MELPILKSLLREFMDYMEMFNTLAHVNILRYTTHLISHNLFH